MGVDRLVYVKTMCKSLNKVLPSDDEIPDTSISTDLKRFVESLDDKPLKKQRAKKSDSDGEKSEGKSD